MKLAVFAHDAASQAGLPLCIGAEFTTLNTDVPNVLLLAKNRQGYSHLTRLLTHARRSQHEALRAYIYPILPAQQTDSSAS